MAHLRGLRLGLAAIAVSGLVAAACVQKPPATSPQLTAHGFAELQRGNPAAALEEANARLKADPRDAGAAFLRAAAQSRLGQFDAARTSFEAFEKAGGRHPQLDLEYGIVLLRTGNVAPATERLGRYRQAQPNDLAGAIALGQAHLAGSRVGPAEEQFKQALAAPATKSAALLNLAILEQRRNDEAAVRRYLQELSASAQNSPEVEAVVTGAKLAEPTVKK